MTSYVDRYGDWALVLGGSEGLGRAIAMELASRGMNLALVARRTEPLARAAEMVRAAHGVDTRTIALDLSADDAVSQIDAEMGGEDVGFVVFNAAAEPFGRFLDLDIEEHLVNIAVNVAAVTRVAHHFGRRMRDRGRGGIVLCSSLAAAAGLYMWSSYGASKSYDKLLAEALWYELRPHGVDVCSLMVGTTWTDSFQRTQKRLGGLFAAGREPADLPPGWPSPSFRRMPPGTCSR